MKVRPGSLSPRTSTARVLLTALSVGLVTLSMVPPVVHSTPHHDEVTPGSVQTLQSPAPAGAANNTTEFPPGTSETGINNVTRLAEAHRSVLNNSTYEAQMEWDQVSGVSGQGSGVEVAPLSMTISSGQNSSLARLVSEGSVNEYWVTDSATAMKTSSDSPTTQFVRYQYHNSPQFWQGAMSGTVHEWLNTSTYDFTGTVTRNNRTLYEFWASGLRGNSTPIEDTHARILVDREGVIHQAIATRTYSRENETVTARLNYDLQRTDVAPPTQPDWVTAELPHLEGSVIGNGTVIALEHTGGATVSNATVSTFFPDGPQIDTEIEDFESGETLYLYRTETAPDRVVVSENEAPAVNESFVPVGEDAVLVSAFDRPGSISGANESWLIEVEPRNR